MTEKHSEITETRAPCIVFNINNRVLFMSFAMKNLLRHFISFCALKPELKEGTFKTKNKKPKKQQCNEEY